jgi:hypothetical protein
MAEIKAATLDLSITEGSPLYENCETEEVAGQHRLKATPEEAVNIVGRNADAIAKRLMADGVQALTLTGRSAIWVYLVVFHAVVHRFREIYYDDGKPGGRVRIAAH